MQHAASTANCHTTLASKGVSEAEEDPKMWPIVSKFPLFANDPQQQAAQPVTQQPQATNDTNLDDDEIPF